MNLLLAFAPFVLFVVIERIWGIKAGLVSATIVAAALVTRDWMSRNRSVKILELGTMALFGGLAAYALLAGATWSVIGVRLRVDAGLMLIVLASIAIRTPFTLQYAREHVGQELWSSSEFIRTNYIITTVWAAAFAVMVAADLVMLYVPNVPLRVGFWTTILSILGAARFTSWYPERFKRRDVSLGNR